MLGTQKVSRVVVAICALLFVVVIGWIVWRRTSVTVVRIAAGAETGQGHAFARALAEVLEEQGARMKLEIVVTEGAAENLALLGARSVDLALAQNDVEPPPSARAIVLVYPQLFHLVAAPGAKITGVADLRGKRVGLPPKGGGSALSFQTLLSHFQLSEGDLTLVHVKSDELAQVFARGEVDAVFRVDQPGDRGSRAVLEAGGTLVPIDQVAALRAAHPYLTAATIPEGLYGPSPPSPARDIETVGVETVLLARQDLDASRAEDLARVLVEHRRGLARRFPAAVALKPPGASDAVSAPAHAGALAYFDREKPGFFVTYAEPIGLFITLAGIAWSLFAVVRARLEGKQKNTADDHNQRLLAVLEDAAQAGPDADQEELRRRMLAIARDVVRDLDHDEIRTESLQAFGALLALSTTLAAGRSPRSAD